MKLHRWIPVLDRFWSLVLKKSSQECWEWQGTKTSYGYGDMKSYPGERKTHRISWTIHNGQIPKGMIIRHSCDNPPCVNPAHLLIGTHANNVADKMARKRHPLQKRNHCPHGHPYEGRNLYISPKTKARVCRTCIKPYKKIPQEARDRYNATRLAKYHTRKLTHT